MAPKLYMTIGSSAVRAVLLTAKAINLELDLMEVNILEQEQQKPEYIKLNPLHTVPTLDDNGLILYDSHAIMGYLIGKYSKDKSLYPEDVKKRALIDQRLYFDSGILFARFVRIVSAVIFNGAKEITEKQIQELNAAYAFIETFLQDNTYMAGNTLSIADFSILATITSANVFVPLDESRYPNIITWIRIMQTLPFYNINQVGVDVFKSIVESKLKE